MLWSMPIFVSTPGDCCRFPQWPLPPGVRAAWSVRVGGVSKAPYDSFNLGSHVGDDPLAVGRNRALWAQQIGSRPVFLDQVHSSHLVALDGATPDGVVADGAWTREPGLACTVLVADCLPVLLCNTDGQTVSAAHAGWRGLAGSAGVGVLEVAHQAHGGAELTAWLGPCIGPTVFEVGEEVRQAFVDAAPQAAQCFQKGQPGKWFADLAGLARQRLAALGVQRLYGNDSSVGWCTVSNASAFFSFRRERVCGRMAASIWRIPG